LYNNYLLIGGKDYVAGPYVVTFPAGTTTVSFNVDIMGDKLLESDETFQLSIIFKTLPNGVTVNDPSNVTVTIVDDDCKLLVII